MRRAINTAVRLFAESFDPPGPIVEIGSLYLAGYEGLCNLRGYFPGREYLGCDIREGLGVDRIEDACALSFADGSAGTVLLCELLEHLPDPQRAINEAKRILRPDGLLAISVPFALRLHGLPRDYWRFTAGGVSVLLSGFPARTIFSVGPRLKPAFVFGVAAKTDSPAFSAARARFEARVGEQFAQSRVRGYTSILKERGRDFFGGLLGRAEPGAAFLDDHSPGGQSPGGQGDGKLG